MKKKDFVPILTLAHVGMLVFPDIKSIKSFLNMSLGSALTKTFRYMFRRCQLPAHHKTHLSLKRRSKTYGLK